MAYRRGSRRRSYRPRRQHSSGWMGIAKKAFRMAKYVRSLVNVEYKNIDFGSTAAISSTATYSDAITDVAQGDDQTNRSGRTIKLTSIEVRHGLAIHASATQSAVRIIFGIDHDPTGVTATAGDLISDTASINSLRTITASQGRFTVLLDRIYDMSNAGTRNINYKWFHKLGHHNFYNGTAAASNGKGRLFMLLISNEATNTVAQDLKIRVKFIDN